MTIKLKLAVLLCLVSLLLVLPAVSACATEEKTISNLVIKVDWVEPVALAAKSYDPPKSLGGEYGTFHVIMSITNPNDFLVKLNTLEPEVIANDIPMGLQSLDSPLYIPPGKEIKVRFPITLNSLNMIKEVVMQKHVSVPDGVGMLLGTWQAIQNGTASYQVRGGAQIMTDSASRYQQFDLSWAQ